MLITPHVIRNRNESRVVSEDFKSKLSTIRNELEKIRVDREQDMERLRRLRPQPPAPSAQLPQEDMPLQPLPPAGQQAVPPAPNPAPKQTQNFAPVAPVIQPLPAKQMSAPAKSMNPTAPADPHHGAAQQFPGAVVQHSAVSPASVMSHTEMVAAPPDATASLWPRGAESSMVAVNRTENSEPLAPPVAVAMNSVDNLLNAIESKTSEPVTLIAPVAQPLRQAPVWVVQVASYGRETEALSYASKLKGKGYDTLVSTTDIAGKTRYRVEVGPLASRNEALALQKTLRTAQHIDDSLVLSKLPPPSGENR